jgi:hypothetical protein
MDDEVCDPAEMEDGVDGDRVNVPVEVAAVTVTEAVPVAAA